MNRNNFAGNPIGIVERNTLLDQVDLQNIFDEWTKDQRISVAVVVRPTTPTSSFFDVYERVTGDWLCMGGKLSCLQQIMAEYGIRRYVKTDY